jgi:hypothetical protein
MENENILSVYSHPDYPSLARQVDLTEVGFTYDPKNKIVVLEVPVQTLDPDGNTIKEMSKPYFLNATNETKVNQLGQPDPQGEIGEFDFFQALAKSPVVIFDLLKGKVQWADATNRLH